MQDDFDNEMGIPDDELAGDGDSAMSEGDALGGHDGDVELEAPESEPVGRASGGARAMSSGGAGKAAPRKAAGAKKKAPKKAAKKARPAARKAAKKSAPKKAARKSAKKKTANKPAKRKAGKKK
jgi:hypothetical protein